MTDKPNHNLFAGADRCTTCRVNEPIYPKLVLVGQFWRCPSCNSSYGENPHPDCPPASAPAERKFTGPQLDALKPCPFCGSPGAICCLEDEPGSPASFWVNCSCGIETRERRTEQEAVALWNTRAATGAGMPTREEIGRVIYLLLYEARGAIWEANESKDVWYREADRFLALLTARSGLAASSIKTER